MTEHIIGAAEAKQRADKLVAALYPQYPRAALRRLFESGHITLNGELAKVGQKLRVDDAISVDLSPLDALPESIELPILYEDQYVLVIDKPAGVIAHARGRYVNEPSVASFIRQKVAGLSGERAGIVHRLDRATSGVMVTAKNPETLSFLQQQFAARKVHKSYRAVIAGTMPSEDGVIDMPIDRNPNKPQTFRVHEDGRSALTRYHVLETHSHRSLLQLEPETGRTHQLRVHLKALGHPICGDDLYGGEPAPRLLLHAYSIEVTLPDKTKKTFISELPESFKSELTG